VKDKKKLGLKGFKANLKNRTVLKEKIEKGA
jgi:hypothetical protein